ncbi:MAG TPA: hypothetical protein VFE46_20225 [Pirellulales bacterium]|jgi:hypothetical protein|nr:hypothetical protein [Pirellulales bacterium]
MAAKWIATKSIAAKWLTVMLVLAGCATARQAIAEQPVPAAADRAGATTQSVLMPPSENAARSKIMASDEWKRLGAEYQKWLSTQPIYTPAQIKRINEKLEAQIQAMPASELQAFMDDWHAKLKVLNGKDFQEAQNWLGAYMTNMADGYRRKYLESLGLMDIPNLSAQKLEAAMTEIRADRQSIAQNQVSFDRLRQQQLQALQTSQGTVQQARQERATQLNSSYDSGSFRSPYSVPFGNNFVPPFGSYLPL